MKKNKIIGLPTEIDATNTSNNPSGIKNAYGGNSEDKIIVVGGSFADYTLAGLWLSIVVFESTVASNIIGSRLIRHLTNIGRNFGVSQGEDWTYAN